ncbi:MAG: hypothetical protein KAS32_00885, partial [Candidatus Peribacteraceae bacterium]|nr:hypothetical protein [Candidatus Peribacteraceae bacterium]
EEVESPTERQRAIAEAIEGIDGKDWISGPVDHPKVTDVATLLDDPTVTEEEIVEVLERWYVTETPECKEPKDDKE